ncbi:MAG: hypothetical protein ACRDOT_08860 [Aeromicrobium sp.]
MASWVELRVHGVSGTPPEEMLAKPHVLQVDGDDKSRFFRAVTGDDRELLATDGHTVEGFHWGRYTSGTWLKALWLALIPFGLVNAATFMLPAAERRDGSVDAMARRWRIGAMAGLRLQAIFLTVVFAFAAGLLLIDIVGTRWAYRNLDSIPDGLEDWIPAGAVILAGLVFVFFGRKLRPGTLLAGPSRTLAPDPALQPVDARAPRDPIEFDPGQRRTPFAQADFYRGDADTPALMALHVAAGLLTIALMAQRFSQKEPWSTGPGLDVIVIVLLIVTIAVTVLLGDPEQAAPVMMEESRSESILNWHRALSKGAAVLLGLAIVAWALAAIAVLQYGLPTAPRRSAGTEGKDRFNIVELKDRVEEFDQLGGWVVALGVVAAIAAAVPALLLAGRSRTWQATPDEPAWYFRPYSGGRASVAFANLAVLLGVGFAAALVTGASTALGLRELTVPGVTTTISGSTPLVDRIAYAWGLGIVIAFAIIVTWLVVSRVSSRGGLATHADIGYPRGVTYPAERPDASPYPSPRLATWRASLMGAVWTSRLKNQADGFVWFIVGLGGVLAAFLGWAEIARLRDDRPWGPLQPLSVTPDEVPGLDAFWRAIAPVLTQIGSWALLGLIVLLVAKGRQAVKDEQTRRWVNVIWDVIAFWPHAVHPFTPEPYSQRTVVDLSERIRYHVAAGPDDPEPGRHVIVCGHSQGSLVSFAAINLLSDAELRRIGLLTFGSQLRVMFPRAFPAYVNHDAIESLRDRLGSAWVNLWRDTDPLAGPVLSWNHTWADGERTCEQFDVPEHAREPQRATTPALVGVDAVATAFEVWRCGDDWRLTDPVRRLPVLPAGTLALQEAPINTLRGHSWFWSDPVWPSALAELRHR